MTLKAETRERKAARAKVRRPYRLLHGREPSLRQLSRAERIVRELQAFVRKRGKA